MSKLMTGPLPWCGTWDVSAMVLFDFCTEQDEDGLPLFEDADKVVFADGTPRPGELDWKNEWNETNAELLSRTEVIRYWKQAAQFLEKWFLRCSDPTTPISTISLPLQEMELAMPLKDLKNMLGKKQQSATAAFQTIFKSVYTLLQYKLKAVEIPTRNTLWTNPFDPPPTLIRIWDASSYTKYSDALGFRCGNWKNCQPANDLNELREKELTSIDEIQHHCEGKRTTSNWISFSDDALWILSKVAPTMDWQSCKVAIVNTASLDALRIPWDRSNALVSTLGGQTFSKKHQTGVNYAWGGHFLVYGWIPDQCILKTFTLAEFKTCCKRRNVREGMTLD
jgi:hypothetical protein